MDVRSRIQMIRTAVIGRYNLWSPRAFIQPTISAFISAYLAVSTAVMLALPILAYRWRQLPFMGAYVEQTLVFNSIRPQGDTPWAGIDAGLAFPAQLIAIDDRAVKTTRTLQATLQTYTAGDEVTLSFTDDAANVHELQLILTEFPASDFNAFFVLPYAVGFVYLVLGVAVFISRSNRTSGRAYALFCGSTAIITGGLFDLYTTHMFSWAWTLAVPIAGASMITIGLAFPERLTFTRRHPLASWIGFVPAVGLIIWGEAVVYDFTRPAAYAQAWRGGFGLGALGTLILIGSMTVRTWGRSSPVTREQARLILWGAALSFGPILYFLVSRTFHYPTLFNVSIYFPPFVALPLMTAYAIVRYRALKTDFVVARVFLYLTLVAIVGLFYAALVTLPAVLSGADLSGNNPFFIVTFIVIVVVLMGPIRGRLVTRIDSLFYFGTTRYHEHLEQFSRQLTASVDVDHVLAAMKRHIMEVLQPETVTAFIINTDQTGYEEQDSAFGQAAVRFDCDSAIASYLRDIDHTVYLAPGAALPAELRADEAQLTALGANLLLALHSRGAMYGWLLTGPRRSGRPYRYRDINFIEVLRDQAAPAIDRALLFEDLKRSETRFRAVVDTSAAAIFIFQGNSLIFVNPETTVQTGYTAQELLEMDFWDLVHPNYRELVRERSLARRPDAAMDSRFDIRIIRKDGHERWLDVALNNYVHEGRPAIIGASIDITEKKHMEMALRDSEERFRQAFERGPLGTMIVNDDLEILRANEAMCSMLGYSEDELTSGAFLDITHPDDANSDLEQMRRMFTGEIPGFKIEKRFIHKNGDIVWTTLTANIMREESGATQYGIGLIEDITARKRAESAKLAAQRQAGAIQSANVELTRSLDTSAVVQTLFAHLQHLVRYDCACIYLRSNGDQFVIDQMQWIERWADPPIARESLNVAVRILPGLQAALENRQTYVAPDTTQIPGWATLRALAFVRSWLAVPLAARDDIIGLYALMRAAPEPFDTEDQRLAESLAAQAAVAIQNARLYDQVTSANLRLRELSQEVAAAQDSERRRIALELHDEAGQALTALKVQLQLLREDTAGNDAGLDKRLAKAVSIVERTDEQIRLLAHALRPPALDTLGLELTLENYCREFAANTKIDIHFDGMDVAPIDDAKSLCFYRTVQEALNNAARHSGADRIDVRLSCCDGVMTLEVEDNGRGIRTGPLNNGGSAKGIGLSGMRDRLELLGGGLTISSEKGRGTLLTAYLAIDGETK